MSGTAQKEEGIAKWGVGKWGQRGSREVTLSSSFSRRSRMHHQMMRCDVDATIAKALLYSACMTAASHASSSPLPPPTPHALRGTLHDQF